MELSLLLAGLAMGVAATPHCAAMCGAPCAALTQGCRRSTLGFHLGRVAGYMAGGALAASSVAALGSWTAAAPALRPLWTLLHLALLALGLWWLATGQPLAWMRRESLPAGAAPVHLVRGGHVPGRPLRGGLAGLAWVAWPCGALQAALLLAALGSSALGGAGVMAAFALGSMPALLVAPWAWARWQAWRGEALPAAQVAAWGQRIAGLGLVAGSGWALTHGLWQRVAAWCLG